MDRMQSTHTAAQRVGKHEDVVDAYLALHSSDPQFLPESDLALPLGAILMTAMYMGEPDWFRPVLVAAESRVVRASHG